MLVECGGIWFGIKCASAEFIFGGPVGWPIAPVPQPPPLPAVGGSDGAFRFGGTPGWLSADVGPPSEGLGLLRGEGVCCGFRSCFTTIAELGIRLLLKTTASLADKLFSSAWLGFPIEFMAPWGGGNIPWNRGPPGGTLPTVSGPAGDGVELFIMGSDLIWIGSDLTLADGMTGPPLMGGWGELFCGWGKFPLTKGVLFRLAELAALLGAVVLDCCIEELLIGVGRSMTLLELRLGSCDAIEVAGEPGPFIILDTLLPLRLFMIGLELDPCKGDGGGIRELLIAGLLFPFAPLGTLEVLFDKPPVFVVVELFSSLVILRSSSSPNSPPINDGSPTTRTS